MATSTLSTSPQDDSKRASRAARTLGQRLKEYRLDKGLSLLQAGKSARLSISTVRYAELGVPVSDLTRRKIERFLERVNAP